jgi:hypothetical protein
MFSNLKCVRQVTVSCQDEREWFQEIVAAFLRSENFRSTTL